MKNILIIAAILILGLVAFRYLRTPQQVIPEAEKAGERALEGFGLKTDTSVSSIDMELILSGGPGKDGIPAINDPKFTSVAEADFADDAQGLFVEFEGERRFYPYPILVWHEIVNDSIGDTHFAVTFCPLCGSGIVFDRKVDGEILTFGVSGLLWESNLLMYDRTTESLWSQAKNEAVVGIHTGQKLTVLPTQLITFGTVKQKYADAKVLSTDTGHIRSYGRNPYSGYEDDENLYFPVSVTDRRFPAKEIMFVLPYEGKSYVLPQLRLKDGTSRSFDIDGGKLVVEKKGGEITATVNGKERAGYYEMWFSWATHHQEDGEVLEL